MKYQSNFFHKMPAGEEGIDGRRSDTIACMRFFNLCQESQMRLLQNILLRGAIAVAISTASGTHLPVYAAEPAFSTIDVQQGRSLKEQGVLLLDVREPAEYEEVHAPGSTLVPLSELPSRLQELRSHLLKPVAVICRSGRRSARAAEIMTRAGFTNVYNVQGGMNAWEAASLPVIKGVR